MVQNINMIKKMNHQIVAATSHYFVFVAGGGCISEGVQFNDKWEKININFNFNL